MAQWKAYGNMGLCCTAMCGGADDQYEWRHGCWCVYPPVCGVWGPSTRRAPHTRDSPRWGRATPASTTPSVSNTYFALVFCMHFFFIVTFLLLVDISTYFVFLLFLAYVFLNFSIFFILFVLLLLLFFLWLIRPFTHPADFYTLRLPLLLLFFSLFNINPRRLTELISNGCVSAGGD